MVSSVAIRLGTDGSAQVKADFAAIAESGDASAKRIVAAYDRASDEVQAAIDKQAKAADRVAGIIPTQTQATINRSVGTGYDGSQNANAAQYAALLAQQEQQAERVRAAIDPLYTAQKRYDAEIASAGNLLRQGVISEAEHAAALSASGHALEEAKHAVEGHSTALGLNRQQSIIAESALIRFTDSVIAGRNPLTAFALESHKAVEVLSVGDGGLSGGLSKVASFITPVSVGITALTAVLAIGAISWAKYTDEMAKLDTIASVAGAVIGVTGQQLEANARAVAANGDITVGSAREIETGYVRMGGIGANVLTGLTQLTVDFAAATGTDAKAAQQELGKAFQDPVKGAEELASRYGLLSQAQVEEIRHLADQNDLYGAQAKLLVDLLPALDGAAKHAAGLFIVFDQIKASISGAWDKLGGFLTGISAATPLAEKLAKLQSERASFGNQFAPGITSNLDQQIADVQREIARQVATSQAAASTFAQDGLAAGSSFTGYSQKQQLEETRDKLQRALADPATAAQYARTGQLDEQKQALEAYTHAINTFLGPAEKKRLIDEDEARLAQARRAGPEAVAAAGRQLATDQARGVVETDAQAQADAAAKGEQSRARLDNAAAKHSASLAREADAMRANTAAALAAAGAYLQSSAAGDDAEARQKAVTDAAKSGASVDEQVARQKALDVANAVRDGDKQTAQLRDETAARERIIALVGSGAISAGQMNDALSDEAKLRPLLIAQSNAQGAALEAATAAVKAHTAAIQEDHAAQERIAAIQSRAANDNSIAGLKDQAQYAGDQSGAGDLMIARRAAEREAAQRFSHLPANDPARAGFIDGQVQVAAQQQTTDRTKLLDSTANSQRDQNEQLQAQIGLIGKSAQEQDQVLAKLRLEQVLRAAGVDLSGEQAQSDLNGAVAIAKLSAELDRSKAGWQEVTQFGDNFIDTVLNPSNWSSFGDMGRKVLADLEQELIKLAAINPLKNMLLGENNPTLSGSGGILSKLFGGTSLSSLSSPSLGLDDLSSMALPSYDFSSAITHFAAGTEYSPAGPAWVGENGPEIVNLPRGASVTNASDTRRLITSSNDSGPREVHNHFSGNLLTPEWWAQIQAGDDNAAMRGSTGGARLSQDRSVKAAKRKLGTR